MKNYFNIRALFLFILLSCNVSLQASQPFQFPMSTPSSAPMAPMMYYIASNPQAGAALMSYAPIVILIIALCLVLNVRGIQGYLNDGWQRAIGEVPGTQKDGHGLLWVWDRMLSVLGWDGNSRRKEQEQKQVEQERNNGARLEALNNAKQLIENLKKQLQEEKNNNKHVSNERDNYKASYIEKTTLHQQLLKIHENLKIKNKDTEQCLKKLQAEHQSLQTATATSAGESGACLVYLNTTLEELKKEKKEALENVKKMTELYNQENRKNAVLNEQHKTLEENKQQAEKQNKALLATNKKLSATIFQLNIQILVLNKQHNNALPLPLPNEVFDIPNDTYNYGTKPNILPFSSPRQFVSAMQQSIRNYEKSKCGAKPRQATRTINALDLSTRFHKARDLSVLRFVIPK